MLDRFIAGFITGIDFLFKAIMLMATAWGAAMPVVAILCYGVSGWWLLSYLFIIPIGCGIINMLDIF